MKKLIAIFLTVTIASYVFAQETYGPIAGERALGVTLNPITNFFGNLFNGTSGNNLNDLQGESIQDPYTIAAGYTNTASIMGKYMLSESTALRANIGFEFIKSKNCLYSQDDKEVALNPLSEAQVVDIQKISQRGASLSLGYEKRFGQGRVQGFVSGSALYAFYAQRANITYGNAITESNQTPTDAFSFTTSTTTMPFARITKAFGATPSHTAGFVGGIGAEYFLVEKVSIGAEVNVYLLYNWSSEEYAEYEGFNVYTNSVATYTDVFSPKSSNFEFSTKNIGANLFMNFYF